ncbi:hypothetical protein [Mycolicibacterium phlei]
MARRTADQLKDELTDPKWRQKFVAICNLLEMLADCIIADSYIVSDELNSAIRLSQSGTEVMTQLTTKHGVNPKDARLACALDLGHEDLFIDVEGTDIDKLAAAINAGVKKDAIRFPFIFGRQLYDAYASSFEDEREALTNQETIRLLDQLPVGVYQYGEFVVGPYGLQKSLESRRIPASRRVPAYHCHRPTCHILHRVTLETGTRAPIHQARDKLERYLQDTDRQQSEWWNFAFEIDEQSGSFYADRRSGVLLPLVGDSLDDAELRLLVNHLLDTTDGEVRRAITPFIEVKNAVTATEKMNRAQLLQIVLIAREEVIALALDRLVYNGAIEVPRGDIRRPVVNQHVRSGAFRLQAELGRHGVRFVSKNPGLAFLRERRLLNKLYDRSPEDLQELQWQLRGIDIDDLDEKLENFLHTRSPVDALRRLVLARKTNMLTACREVGVENGESMSDDELIDTMLWKLGFPIDLNEDPHATFWKKHERLWALTQSSSIGTSDRFREVAAVHFTELEGLLADSLAFTAWALLVDHTEHSQPFAYDDHDDRRKGLEQLQVAWTSVGTSKKAVNYAADSSELFDLIDGFRVLAVYLEDCCDRSEEYARPNAEFPEYDGKTDLMKYLLRSKLPFLNLSRPSQERIIEGLTEISRSMAEAEVSRVRNDYAHYRRTPPDISKMEKALEAIRYSVTKIENLGFCRLLYSPSSEFTDQWGQSNHEFVGPRSYEHVFTRPTPYDWMGLPSLHEPQYLMRAASFGDPNEVLRFTRRHRSAFSEMWTNFPNRRKRGPGAPATEEEPAHKSDAELSAN